MEINTFDIVLINIISYMGGIFTGLLFCCKYKDKLIIKSKSRDNLSTVANPTNLLQPPPPPPPAVPSYNSPVLVASAPPLPQAREITIKTME